MQGALDARAKLASPARQEDEERDEKRLSKADRTARATSSATFFNSIGQTSSFGQCRLNVRITPESARIADIGGRLKRANRDLTHCSKRHGYAIRSCSPSAEPLLVPA